MWPLFIKSGRERGRVSRSSKHFPRGITPAGRSSPAARFEKLEQRLLLSAKPTGLDFMVSSHSGTYSGYERPAVAMAPNGDFVVAWDSSGAADDVLYRLYDADGTPKPGFSAPQAVVATAHREARPDVAMDALGNFVVVWDAAPSGGDSDVFFQRFNASGLKIGTPIQANTVDAGREQMSPKVAMSDNGDFVVVYQDWLSPSNPGLRFDYYYSDGGPKISGGIVAATYRMEFRADVAMESDSGDFVVAWEEWDDGNWDAYFGVFDAEGDASVERTQANATDGDKHQITPAVAMDQWGNFTIVWTHAQTVDAWDVFMQQFNSAGGRYGPEVPVHAGSYPTVGMSEDQIVVAYMWQGVSFQQFSADYNATARGPRINIQHSRPTYRQWTHDPSVAMNARGEFAVACKFDPQRAGVPDSISARNYRHDQETPGLYDPSAGVFHLKNANRSGGGADLIFHYGPDGNRGWIPLIGDWDFSGTDTVGLYDPAGGVFHLKNTNANPPGGADVFFRCGPTGNPGWVPLAGDWDGDGYDTVGLYDPAAGVFHLKSSNAGGGGPNVAFRCGPRNSSWTPLVGDWDGDGIDTVGLYDPAGGAFHLKNVNANPPGGADVIFRCGPRSSTWTALTGDWNRDGVDTVGLYDPQGGAFHLKNSNATGGGPNVAFRYGPKNSTWTPLAGDWDGPGVSAKAAGAALLAGEAQPAAAADLQPIIAEALSRWDTTPEPADDELAPSSRPGLAEIDALFARL